MSNPKEMRALATVSDPRWAAVAARDPAADGRFFYSVRTTGVYCRPSCAARAARPENVAFHATAADAERAGFRPCRRCKPDQPALAEQHAAMVAGLCRFIEDSPQPPTLDALAERAGLSSYHLHRVFKELTGLTPKAYAEAQRGRRVRHELGRSDTVTDAIYDAGYNSNGRFYANSNEMLGMTPTRWRAGGAGTEIRFAIGECTLGAILVAQSERGVCAIALGDDAEALVRDLQDQFPQARLVGGDADFEQLVARVVGLVEAPGLGLDLPLDVRGTAFQQRVWQALREIPAGSTASYADVARRIGAPKSVRAVAQACGANHLAVAIPCHRVVRSDGGLSGYRWGVERKSALLRREGVARMNARDMGTPLAMRARGLDVEQRVGAVDWASVREDLDAQGAAVIEGLLAPSECEALAALYAVDDCFRSRVVMARHGFGQGEYKYFAYPLPGLVAGLREAFYPRLVPVANRWNECMGIDLRYPERHADFMARCHAAGQQRPTPLLLQYQAGDYNCLHQDLYGEHVFPLQLVVLLSEPGRDFGGGEFVMTEQRPRMQSRPMVLPLRQGDAAVIAVHHRPVQGTRGIYRVNLRHGVSRVRSGRRHTMGIIFHDAA